MKAVTETQSRLFNYVGDGGMTIYLLIHQSFDLTLMLLRLLIITDADKK